MSVRIRSHNAGLTLLELLFAIALGTTLTAMAVPATRGALDALRAAGAARYMASRVMKIRMEAVRSSAAVALRFEARDDDYVFAPFVDGNGNGVRTSDILSGVDRQAGPYEQLSDKFSGMRFHLPEGLPDADGAPGGSTDGVRIGSSRILTMSPDGTATSGTLYLAGRGWQYAIRVLGATGRVRVLVFSPADNAWVAQ